MILLAAGAYVGWNAGANDTANCIGTTVGAGLLPFRRAVLIVAVCAMLGALLQGQHVMKTIGSGIIHHELDFQAVCVALISAGVFVSLATFKRIPTSTSQAIVGGLMGIGLTIHAHIDTAKFWTIAGSWVVCPLLVMGLAYGLTHLIGFIISRLSVSVLIMQQIMGGLAILSGGYVAFSMGANNAGNAVGLIANQGIFPPVLLLALGGGAIAGGAITYGRRVAETVGKGITPLDVRGAFVAQTASAAGIHLFSVWGIPVSTSSAIVGAVVGIGLVKGGRAISKKTILIIMTGWVLTPCLAAATSFSIYALLAALIS